MEIRWASVLLLVAVVVTTCESTSQYIRFRAFSNNNCTTGGSWAGYQPGVCMPLTDSTSRMYICESNNALLLSFPDNECKTAAPTTINFTKANPCILGLSAVCAETPSPSTQLVPYRRFNDATCTTGGVQRFQKVGYCLPQPDGSSRRFGCLPNGTLLQLFRNGMCDDVLFDLVEFPDSRSCLKQMQAGACFQPSPIPTDTFFVASSYEGQKCGSSIVQAKKISPSGSCYADPTRATSSQIYCQNSSVLLSTYSDVACTFANLTDTILMDGYCFNQSEVPTQLSCLAEELNQSVTRSRYWSNACTGLMADQTVMRLGCTEAKNYNASASTWSPGSYRVIINGSNFTHQKFSSSDCSGDPLPGESMQGECGSCVSFKGAYYQVTCPPPAPAPPWVNAAFLPGLSFFTAMIIAVSAVRAE